MRLKKFLAYFEFDYRYDGDEIALVDLAGSNLGNIESERFLKNNLSSIVDRLDIYYEGYIFEDLGKQYGIFQGDWQDIYKKAIKENDPSLEYLKVIMCDEKVTLHNIVHDIQWDADDDVDLPEYMVIPEDIDEEEISDYISNQTGYCHFGYTIGMAFIDCVDLLKKCIDRKLINYDVEMNNGSILVYRTAGLDNPEGWYWQNVLEAASELYRSEMSQIELIKCYEQNKNRNYKEEEGK